MSSSVDPLNPAVAGERLARGAVLVQALFEGLSAEQQRWKPSPERWSLLEVVAHLADEEVFDFRDRIERTLRDPTEVWPSIAPQDWVTERKYDARDPGETLARFLDERRRSCARLAKWKTAKWSNAHVHPKAGPLSARMLLANWIAHDLLHARQMLRLHHEWLALRAAPDNLDYAGKW